MKILLVDDHALFRDGVALLLKELDPAVQVTVLERLDTPVTGSSDDATGDGADEGEDDEVSGPIAIAVDVNEPADKTEAAVDNPAP